MYQLIEHTADVGFRVTAPNLTDLLEESARALFALIVLNSHQIQPKTELQIKVLGDRADDLLLDWLSELLYVFDSQRIVFCRFNVHVAADGVSGQAWGEPLDPSRHQLGHEVKAITYHDLTVRRMDDRWEAKVIVDV